MSAESVNAKSPQGLVLGPHRLTLMYCVEAGWSHLAPWATHKIALVTNSRAVCLQVNSHLICINDAPVYSNCRCLSWGKLQAERTAVKTTWQRCIDRTVRLVEECPGNHHDYYEEEEFVGDEDGRYDALDEAEWVELLESTFMYVVGVITWHQSGLGGEGRFNLTRDCGFHINTTKNI